MRLLSVNQKEKIIIFEMNNGINNETNIINFIRNNIEEYPERLGYRYRFIIKMVEDKEFYFSTTVTDVENIKLSWEGATVEA